MIAKTAAAILIALTAVLLVSSSANAKMAISSFTTTSSETQAGGHPDLSTSFTLAEPGIKEAARNVTFNAPEGLFGNIGSLLACTSSDFALDQCPPNAQAGLVTIWANHGGDSEKLLGTAPMYNLEPGPDETGLFGLVVPSLHIPIQIPVAVRTGTDYGLRFTVAELTQTVPLARADLTFWGFPLDESHTSERFPRGGPGHPQGCPGRLDLACSPGVRASSISVPLIDNPTVCTGTPLITELRVQSYQDPENLSTQKGEYPATTGCEKEVFKPVLFTSITTDEADSPSGLNLELKVPQYFGLTPAPSQLRTAIVALPEGLTINPDAADGQTACSEADANFGSEDPAACPDSSKIGTFLLNTPALDGPLVGSLYIGQPQPGNQYRLFMVADGFGVHAKLIGTFHPDPQTGRLTAEFSDLPQVPFDDLQMHLFSSDRGLLATPTHCTVYDVAAHFFPWNSQIPDVVSTEPISVTSGPHRTSCPGLVRPFSPRLDAGTSNPVAGAFSAFNVKLDRDDGDQFLGDLNFRMPPGFTGDLRGIPYCSEASIAAAAGNSGRAERLDPELSGCKPDRHHQCRRGAGWAPVSRGRQDVSVGSLQGGAAEPCGDHPGSGGPL